MCGIVGVFELKTASQDLRLQVLEMSKKIRHRGPDWSGIYCGEKAILAHERLSIVDPQSGGQPLKSKDGKLILSVNGEIYNHMEIRKNLSKNYEFLTPVSYTHLDVYKRQALARDDTRCYARHSRTA